MNDSFFKRAAYAVVDLLTLKRGVNRRINNMSIRFPARWSRYYETDYEADNYLFLQQQVKKGMHIIDIGAHLGLFSAASSQLVGPEGKIICFEPTPGTFLVLKETLRLNHCKNVIALQEAVSSKEGSAAFFVSETAGCNTNSLVDTRKTGRSPGYTVRITTIDSTVRKYLLQPSLIKIDAEGSELDVLKGATETMKHSRPVIILGLHPAFINNKGESLSGIYHLITGNGYKIIYEGAEMTVHQFISQTELFDVHLLPV